MPFDFKKEFKNFYHAKTKPEIVTVPKMKYLAVRGKGNPNEENGEYKQSIELLYPIAYTLKMSKNSDYKIHGYFDYVVPPLEGFWWQEGVKGVDYSRKEDFRWISLIRLPDFVTEKDFNWAIEVATQKKRKDFSKIEFFTYEGGLCVQAMHIGPFEKEIETVEKMHRYIEELDYELDISDDRHHQEIYLSDMRRVSPEKYRTLLRHPIKTKDIFM